MYSYETRIGFSQADTDRKVKMEAMLDLFQDATCFQGEELGVGFEYLDPMHCAWLLNSWQIDVLRFPKFNEKIEIGTFPTSFKGFIGNRDFVAKDMDGNVIVMARSMWTFMDMEKMRPAKIAPKFAEVYELEEALPMENMGRKISLPTEDEGYTVREHGEVKVREYHLDSNMHVNNGQYVHIASGFLPKGQKFNRLRVEYRKQAVLGDVMIPITYYKEGACMVALCDAEKNPYAVIETTMVTIHE